MKYLYFVLIFTLISCSSGGNLSNEQAALVIEDYYSDKGCYSKLSLIKIGELRKHDRKRIEEAYEKLIKGDQHKTISWVLETINGIMIADDGNSATVDFTLKGKATQFFSFQEYKICGSKEDFGPWDMVAELVKYDTGWKVKSKPSDK